MFLMPGMTEGHAHLSFEAVTATEDLITPSPEAHTLLPARVAKVLLDLGFTIACGPSESNLRPVTPLRPRANSSQLPGMCLPAVSLELTLSVALRADCPK